MRHDGKRQVFGIIQAAGNPRLRDHGTEYRILEDGADDFTQNRLRILRQMRNYLTHQSDPGFLSVSEKQIAYLEKLVKEQSEQDDLLRKHLKSVKVSCCTASDLLSDVLKSTRKST